MPPRWIIGLVGITVGLPLLVLYAIVSSTGAVSPSIFNIIVVAIVLAAFLAPMVCEIMRLVEHHDAH